MRFCKWLFFGINGKDIDKLGCKKIKNTGRRNRIFEKGHLKDWAY